MAKSLRQEIITWVQDQGGVAWKMTTGVGGAFFRYGKDDEVLAVIHFVVGIGHTSEFTDARIRLIEAFGYMAGRVNSFDDFKELVRDFKTTGCKARLERETDHPRLESSRSESLPTEREGGSRPASGVRIGDILDGSEGAKGNLD